MTPKAQPSELVKHLAVHPSDLPDVRQEITRYLKDIDLAVLVDDTCLLVTELLSNVHKHVPDHRAVLRVVPQDGTVHVVVSDNSNETPLLSPQPPDWDAEDGRGMWLINEVAEDWITVITGAGKSIDCTVRRPLAAAASR